MQQAFATGSWYFGWSNFESLDVNEDVIFFVYEGSIIPFFINKQNSILSLIFIARCSQESYTSTSFFVSFLTKLSVCMIIPSDFQVTDIDATKRSHLKTYQVLPSAFSLSFGE